MKFGISWLDFKLGFRMLVKYPGLTLVGGLAIAFAIWVGAGTFEFINQVLYPTLPLDEGNRIVGIHQRNAATARAQEPSLHDFAAWRGELRSVDELGAFRMTERNLIVGAGAAEPVEVTEMSAAGFRVARVPPLLGRPLIASDEQPDAAPVAVIGHDVWQQRFDGAAEVVGQVVRLGRTEHTVIGVMPEGFAFPVAQSLWVPLRSNPLDYAPGQSPRLRVFGRLAPGASFEEAQAELSTLGRRVATASPETHEHLRPEVLPYARSILNLPTLAKLGLGSTNLLLVVLLLLICGNVALLMFARAASRENELAVRSALGASRRRIIAQLFAEALVLSALGAALGLAAVSWGLRWGYSVLEAELLDGMRLPFWFHTTLSPATLLYAVLLAVLAAVVAGVLPGRKATSELRARLQQATAGGGGWRFGGVWTAVIVAQIALTFAFPVVAVLVNGEAARERSLDLPFADEEILSARIEMDREGPTGPATGSLADELAGHPAAEESADAAQAEFQARYAAAVRELKERLEAEPAVTAVAFAERIPRMYHRWRQIEVEGGSAPPPDERGHRLGSSSVEPGYFDALGVDPLAGRGFHSGDLDSEAEAVIVNQSFVTRVLGGRNPLGRRIRYLATEEYRNPNQEPGPWLEIVGVVPDLGTTSGYGATGVYHPIRAGGVYPGHLAVHTRGNPAAFTQELRSLATRVDPSLRLYEVQPLPAVIDPTIRFYRFWFWLVIGVSAVTALLSLAGIYAVMSFAVAQRTREIGIRVALGGSTRRIVLAVFRRPLAQIGLGIVAGTALTALLVSSAAGAVTLDDAALVGLYALLMTGVCMLACIVPTRRALGVEPTEALRADV